MSNLFHPSPFYLLAVFPFSHVSHFQLLQQPERGREEGAAAVFSSEETGRPGERHRQADARHPCKARLLRMRESLVIIKYISPRVVESTAKTLRLSFSKYNF